MTSPSPRVTESGADPRISGGRLTIDLGALQSNYRMLRAKSGRARAAAVVKGDAYGIGLEVAATALADAGCTSFFVALIEEGLRLRRALPDAEIFVLSGVFDSASAAVLTEAHLHTVLNSLDQIDIWTGYCRRHGMRRPCAIHVDTGMNRMGLSVEEALAFAEQNARDHAITPILLMSHLACADEPSHPLNLQQLEVFQRLRAAFPGVESSLANSAGIFLGGEFHFELTRPGIGLYGGEAVTGIANPMAPVVTAEARILQIRHAEAGETVSYGASITLRRDTTIAVLGAGYADGYLRSASGSGVPMRDAQTNGAKIFVGGHRAPLLGRVTMDLVMADITDVPDVQVGDFVELFGANISIDDVARTAGTISYELLTSLGSRCHRRHIHPTKAP